MTETARKSARQLTSITWVECENCGHRIVQHMAESEHPEFPGKMPCEIPGCECVDFSTPQRLLER